MTRRDQSWHADEYDLLIEKTKDVYEASWLVKGQLQTVGVGMEVENGVAVGWRRIKN